MNDTPETDRIVSELKRESDEWLEEARLREPSGDEGDTGIAQGYASGFHEAANMVHPVLARLERERDEARRLAETWQDVALLDSHGTRAGPALPWEKNG